MQDFPQPVSINWHFWPHCNYRCKFCFGTFRDIKGILPIKKAVQVPRILAKFGCHKLTFSGGEPTLCPYLGDLLKETKEVGITTMVISNGTGLTLGFLEKNIEFIDWIGLSIDSASESTEKNLGRGKGDHVRNTIKNWHILEDYDVKLKLNTVVTSLNWNESLYDLINELNPVRWKVFQVLLINGQNNRSVDNLLITKPQFQSFVDRHKYFNPIAETTNLMKGSYIMIDPLGRCFQNTTGSHKYSQSIFDTSFSQALNQVGWNYKKFIKRHGIYHW